MAARLGVTPDIETSKWQVERAFKNTRNWKVTKPFASKKDANSWLTEKKEEMKLEIVKQKIDTSRIRVEWRGFYFEHDGPTGH
ncbi:MAG: hypothetical protein HRU19_18760 [Pseudobacteriovorax sp.]|nr:hypothetical protein [Pseudobacteriovorax sp.]